MPILLEKELTSCRACKAATCALWSPHCCTGLRQNHMLLAACQTCGLRTREAAFSAAPTKKLRDAIAATAEKFPGAWALILVGQTVDEPGVTATHSNSVFSKERGVGCWMEWRIRTMT